MTDRIDREHPLPEGDLIKVCADDLATTARDLALDENQWMLAILLWNAGVPARMCLITAENVSGPEFMLPLPVLVEFAEVLYDLVQETVIQWAREDRPDLLEAASS